MTVDVRELEIEGVYEITPRRFADERGFFSETFNAVDLSREGVDVQWVQDNHALSAEAGVLRGLHYQLPPFAQDKLVRVCRGRVYDVVVDVRKNSPSFGRWLGLELSAEKWNQLFVPRGFAHGYLTLEPDTEFLYKVSNVYSAECDRGIRYDDPALAIHWPLDDRKPNLSIKDREAPPLEDADLPESWDA